MNQCKRDWTVREMNQFKHDWTVKWIRVLSNLNKLLPRGHNNLSIHQSTNRDDIGMCFIRWIEGQTIKYLQSHQQGDKRIFNQHDQFYYMYYDISHCGHYFLNAGVVYGIIWTDISQRVIEDLMIFIPSKKQPSQCLLQWFMSKYKSFKWLVVMHY
eukprot:330915_1